MVISSYESQQSFEFSGKEVLARDWIETIIGQQLSSGDLYDCLKDGVILSRVAQCLLNRYEKPSNHQHNPKAHIEFFLKIANDFGLEQEELFSPNDLINGENMGAVITTILLLSYSYKQHIEKSDNSPSLTSSYFDTETLFDHNKPTKHAMTCHTVPHNTTKTNLYLKREQEKGMIQERDREEEEPETIDLGINLEDWSFYHQGLTQEDLSLTDFTRLHDSPPYDIKRPNCVPAFGSFSISDFKSDEDDSIDQDNDTHQQDNDVHDLFESLFAPISSIPTIQQPDILSGTSPSLKMCPPPASSAPSKLSLLFKKKSKSNKDPHFVKFQTWSKQHPKRSLSTNGQDEQMSWMHFLEEEERDIMPSIMSPAKTRPRSSTDASLIHVAPPLVTGQQTHTRCKSIGSLVDPPSFQSSKSLEYEGLELVDKAGNILARYKLGNVIGKGHFGTVYRALDLISGKTVAIKQISLKDAREGDIEDMMQEASLLSSLTHPNIVKYEGFIQTEEHMNIALEFVENGSLLHTLKHFGGALPENLVAGYCYDILQGLAYLHQQDVVHCDLKAANILTTKTGDVKLSDFGVSLSLKLKDKDDDTIVSGTPFWMSPEVIELKGASVQSDIWSLGCTVIELCTGKPPYADLIAMTAMFKIVEEDCPPLPTNVSDDLLDFLKLCFKKNPVERPRAIHLVHHPWITQHRAHSSYDYWHQMTQTPNKWTQHINHTYPMPTKSSVHNSSPLLNRMASQQKKQKRASSLSRQSLPTLGPEEHQHTLIECSFPKGVGQCKLCNLTIKNDAFVCSDFCGFVCHKHCRSSDEPRPTGSISSQLRDKFSISKILPSYHDTNPVLLEDESSPSYLTSKWWKKKP